MFTQALTYAGHVRRFSIYEAAGQGWEVREEQDSQIVRRTRLNDWHRVERELRAMTRAVRELEDRGWICLS
jgi:hypothetical protein